MRVNYRAIIITIVITALIACAAALKAGVAAAKSQQKLEEISIAAQNQEIEIAEQSDALRDVDALYTDDPSSLVTLYITARRGNKADKTDNSFADVTAVVRTQETYVEPVSCEALVQFGDESGPLSGEIGYGQTISNATIRVRGRTSTMGGQKSYRIDLLDNAGLWRGQRAIAINKHIFDATRLRNKLYFDMLHEIGLMSLRTQFMHVYVKDETTEPAQTEFVDYGLFTFVETPNKRFLRNHGLNSSGYLYKPNIFEFYRYPESLKLATDPDYDERAFEMVMETKGSLDHTKLLNMLDEVNDYTQPIEEVFERNFHTESFFEFYAYNILMGNIDTNSQNFLLYSDFADAKWYFLFWDGDGSMERYEGELLNRASEGEWHNGVSNYWGVVLFNRVMRVPKYRQMLDETVERMLQKLKPEKIKDYIDDYAPIVQYYLYTNPDYHNSRLTEEQLNAVLAHMPNEPRQNYEHYKKSYKKPMPFFIGNVTRENDEYVLTWDESYDFEARTVTYDVDVASDWQFTPETTIFSQKDVLSLSARFSGELAPGQYYVRVTSKNSEGCTQESFDAAYSIEGRHNSMRLFRIDEEGRVSME